MGKHFEKLWIAAAICALNLVRKEQLCRLIIHATMKGTMHQTVICQKCTVDTARANSSSSSESKPPHAKSFGVQQGSAQQQ
jgi:hypothetical protein